MSAPPLIRPPTSRSKFPSLAIPKSSGSVSVMGPDSKTIHMVPLDGDGSGNNNNHLQPISGVNSSQQAFGRSPSGYFSAELIAAVGGSSSDALSTPSSTRLEIASHTSTQHTPQFSLSSSPRPNPIALPTPYPSSSSTATSNTLNIPQYYPPNSNSRHQQNLSISSSTSTANSGPTPFPFPVRHSPSFGTLNINTSLTATSINNNSIEPALGTTDVVMGGTDETEVVGSRRSVAFISTEQSQQIAAPVPHNESSHKPVEYPNLYEKYKNLDVDDLGEDDWKEVAKSGAIEELGRLGEGAGGSVTRCKLRSGKTVFALKAITSNPNHELQKQILRELQFNRSCNSPHIVKYYGTFLNEELASIFIAMEYCGGGSLEAIYKRVKARGGRIGEKVLGKIAEGVLSGLSYLHERRIIHRDIKPQNILLDTQGQVKLCDFGVSGEVVDSLATTFTGTSYYMAPERIQGQPYTVTSDVWSLGLTIMEVAQHRFPFLPENHEPLMPIELLTVIVNMPAPELADEPSEGIKWSKSFRHFLLCCLEKDPRKRASPRQMLTHPWIAGQRNKTVKMAKFVRECWL